MTASRISAVDPVTDLVDRLRLDRSARRRGAVVVEGPTDVQVLARALEMDERRFFPVNGRNNVLKFAEHLDAACLTGVICIADRDFDDSAHEMQTDVRVVFTDNGDLEAMLIISPAFARVLAEWATRSKVARLGGQLAVRERVWTVVTPVSVLRRANAVTELGLRFDGVDLHEVFTRPELELRVTGYLDRLAAASGTSRGALEEILVTAEPPVCASTGELLVRGRDVIAVAEVGLTRLFGGLQLQQAKDLVERCLRLAVSAGDFDELPFRIRVDSAMAEAA